jgi:hypothetical protein
MHVQLDGVAALRKTETERAERIFRRFAFRPAVGDDKNLFWFWRHVD